MTRPLTVAPESLSPSPPTLQAIDRAAAELRRGGVVVVCDAAGTAIAAIAAEAASPESLARLVGMGGGIPAVAVTGRRAAVLGLAEAGGDVVLIKAPAGFDAATVARLADPCVGDGALPGGLLPTRVAVDGAIGGAVTLNKLARLLPAAVVVRLPGDGRPQAERFDLFRVTAAGIAAYQQTAARSLRAVSEARVPLAGAPDARIVAFRPSDGGIEHLAIIIGEPDRDRPVLTRLHSECFTGDLLGSLRCDCGDQLRGAIAEIAQGGGGVLLYLAQEGRGIGLVNKLRAYQLQDVGFDTLDANGQLGFDDDERIYLPAAEMLRLLGIAGVRLLTNNPLKVEALARHDIEVAERVPHVFPANDHNALYLRTKQTRSGHLF